MSGGKGNRHWVVYTLLYAQNARSGERNPLREAVLHDLLTDIGGGERAADPGQCEKLIIEGLELMLLSYPSI
jgi:hypothetical protein